MAILNIRRNRLPKGFYLIGRAGGDQPGPGPEPVDPSTVPFYFEDITGEEGNIISIVKYNASAPTVTVECSTDNKTWETLGDTSTTALNKEIPAGGKLYLRAVTDRWASGTIYYNMMQSNKAHNVGGNSMSLLYGEDFADKTELTGSTYQFAYLFNNDTMLNNSDKLVLPATALTNYCYYRLFRGCSNLKTTPVLPATSLGIWCYDGMFMDCSSITTAPELPVINLTTQCYGNMFYGCTSLTEAPVLPATILQPQCYDNMFYGCTSLTEAPELPATTLASNCYHYMFYGCTSLTEAPELPATTLVNRCYNGMFSDCTSLKYIKVAATSWDISNTYVSLFWVSNVAASGTFVKPSALKENTSTTVKAGYIRKNNADGIPSGWTVENV